MSACGHADTIVVDDGVVGVAPQTVGCEDCLAIGGRWVHLRRCLDCGHVGCCNSSPNKHAMAHAHATTHPLVQSFEPGEEWFWCYTDSAGFNLHDDLPPSPSHP